MWNSPHSHSNYGKRYSLADLSVLVLPLDELLYLSEATPVSELVEEETGIEELKGKRERVAIEIMKLAKNRHSEILKGSDA